MFAILFVSLVCANTLPNMKEYERGLPVTITQPCDDATYINLSFINYPDSTRAIGNIEMIYNGSGSFYYIFNDTAELGRYDFGGISDGCFKTFTSYFTITPEGETPDTGAAIIYMLSLCILMFFIFILYKTFTAFSKSYDRKTLYRIYETQGLYKFMVKLLQNEGRMFIGGIIYLLVVMFFRVGNQMTLSFGLLPANVIFYWADVVLINTLIPFAAGLLGYTIYKIWTEVKSIFEYQYGDIVDIANGKE